MAGYSGKPLIAKLGLKGGMKAAFVSAPDHYLDLLDPIPGEVRILSRPGKAMDFLHLFVTRRADLERRLLGLEQRLAPTGMLWISWPKGSSDLETDLKGDVVRTAGLAAGLVDVKVCAVDADWSGLKFMFRLKDR